jgi:hypothetical protein
MITEKLKQEIKEQAIRTRIIYNYTPDTEAGVFKKQAKENMELAEQLLLEVSAT